MRAALGRWPTRLASGLLLVALPLALAGARAFAQEARPPGPDTTARRGLSWESHSGSQPGPRRVLRCELSPHHRMELLARPQGGPDDASVELYTRLRGKVEPAFTPQASGAAPTGRLGVHLCLQGVMVYVLRGDGWVRAAVVRRQPGTHKLERLDVVDTSEPYGLYVNDDEMRVVVPRRGRTQYTVYSTRTGRGRPSNILPSGHLFRFHALQ